MSYVTPWNYRRTVLLVCTLGFVATMTARVVISPVVPDLTISFDVSTGAIGLALTGMWATYALAQFPSGVLADRFGARSVVLLSLAGTCVASLLLALSPSYLTFVFLAVILGGAAGMVYSAAAILVTKHAAETGRAMGIFIAGGPFAGLLAPPAAAALGTRYGWEAAVALGAVVALPALVLFSLRIESTPPTDPQRSVRERVDGKTALEILSRPAIARTVVLAVLGAFTWQATASFLPAFLEAFRGFSRTDASLLFSAYFLIHGLSMPLIGILSDRYSRDAAATLTMGAGVAGYTLLVIATSTIATIGAIVLIGLAMSWGAPLQSRFMDLLSEAELGTGFGLVRTVYMLLGALGSVVTGVVVDVVGWQAAFTLLAGCMTLATLVLVADRVVK